MSMNSVSARLSFLVIWVSTLIVGLTFAIYIHLFLRASVERIPARRSHPSPAYKESSGKLGAVSSESSICSQIGIDLLKRGGNAVDAVVGTVLCVGVIGMYHSGIGGGGFMLVRSSNGSYEFIDFRETAPKAAFEDMYEGNVEGSLRGGLSSGVPGELRGLEYLHNTYGRLPWRILVEPSIKVARYGFPVSADLVREMEAPTVATQGFLVKDQAWAIDFAPNGTRLGLGDTMTRKRYAEVLELIASNGADAFYTGKIAEATISAVRAANGTMTLEDLNSYAVEIREPVSISYRDYRVVACSAPSGGAVALSALKLVEGYSDIGAEDTVMLSTHRLDEALRFAYGMRPRLGDPSFVSGLDHYQREMLNDKTAAQHRAKISDAHTLNISAYDPEGLEIVQNAGTSHVVSVDAQGMAITITTTINNPFGSRVMVPETGVVMNNEMNDFSIPNTSNVFGYVPAPANFIRPGKRPLSSITPVIVEHLANSTLYFVVGAAGGSRIITAVTQALWFVLDVGLSSAQALQKPRFHDQLIPNQIGFEYSYNNLTVDSMKAKGHNATWLAPGLSHLLAIRRLSSGHFEAACDPNLVAGAGLTV